MGRGTASLVDEANNYVRTNAYYAVNNLAATDGIVINLSKSATSAYPAPQHNIKGINLGTLNSTKDGKKYKIQKIGISVSSDNIAYTQAGAISNTGPDNGRVNLSLDNINQADRWIKLQITPEPGTTDYFIDEVEINNNPY